MWQVEVNGEVYEADLVELAAWVADGALQPEDKVRRGNLRWIEARRVPNLLPHFNAKRDGTPPPKVVVNVTDAATQPPVETVPAHVAGIVPKAGQPGELSKASPTQSVRDPDFCSAHQDIPSVFVCKACGSTYCKA
ncbi:MAG: hypothetical protein ACRD43_11200, partial [Pyrinomonadaceae bacterium]